MLELDSFKSTDDYGKFLDICEKIKDDGGMLCVERDDCNIEYSLKGGDTEDIILVRHYSKGDQGNLIDEYEISFDKDTLSFVPKIPNKPKDGLILKGVLRDILDIIWKR